MDLNGQVVLLFPCSVVRYLFLYSDFPIKTMHGLSSERKEGRGNGVVHCCGQFDAFITRGVERQ